MEIDLPEGYIQLFHSLLVRNNCFEYGFNKKEWNWIIEKIKKALEK